MLSHDVPDGPDHSMSQKRVLIVEDNRLTMALFRTILHFEGYHVLEAATAGAGLDAARRYHPALIIMDINLPDKSGLEATRILKSVEPTRGIPVLVTSAQGSEIDTARLREAGCDSYLPAPVHVPDLIGLVRAMLTPHWTSPLTDVPR
jgi:two-component system, cell cycle response regulator DivK